MQEQRCRASRSARSSVSEAAPPPPVPHTARRTTARGSVVRRLGQVADALGGLVLRPRVLQGRDQLLDEARRRVDPGDDRPRHVALLDLVLDARKGERELVAREADVREVRVCARDHRRLEMDVEPPVVRAVLLLVRYEVVVHAGILGAVQPNLRVRQVFRLAAAIVVTLVAGTIAFHATLSEGWFQSLYRAVVTATLAGLDTVPRSDGARLVSILLVLAGLTIIAYAGAVIVEAIAGGVFTGVLTERRRERTIERLHDHFIICGYGRVGRQVAEEFRTAGVRYVVLDFSEEAIANAREHGDLLIEGNATEDEDLRRAGLQRAKGVVVASDSDPDNLYIALSARNARPDIQIV